MLSIAQGLEQRIEEHETIASVQGLDEDELVRLWHGERPQHDGVKHAEGRSRGADPERERTNRHRREGRAVAQHA